MPRLREQVIQLPKITRGLNTRVHPSNTPDDQCPSCLNVDFSNGVVTKRTGADPYGNDLGTGSINGLYTYTQRDGDAFQIAAWNTSHYYDVAGTWTTLATGLTANAELAGVSYQDIFYHTDGSNGYRKWTGTGNSSAIASQPAASVKCKYIEVYEDRMWLAHDATGTVPPYRVYYSQTGTPEDFSSPGGFLDVSSHDGTPVNQIMAWKEDFLLIFKDNSVHRVWYNDTLGTPAYQRDLVFPNIGTVSPRSVVRAGQAIIFLDADRRVRFLGQLPNYPEGAAEQELSHDIRPDLEGIVNIEEAAGLYHRGKYYLAVTSSGTANDTVYVYDLKDATWTLYTGWHPHCWNIFSGTVYFGASNDAQVHQLTTNYNDNGVAIPAYVETKYYDFGVPNFEKTLNHLDTTALLNTGSDIDLEIKTDFASTGTTASQSLGSTVGDASASYTFGTQHFGDATGIYGGADSAIASSGQFLYWRHSPFTRGQYFQFRVSNDDLDEEMQLLGLTAHVSAEAESDFDQSKIT